MIEFQIIKQESGTFRGFIHFYIIDNKTSKFVLSPEEFEKLKKKINEVK